MALSSTLRDFPGLSHHAFQHPLDSQAQAALEKVPLLPTLVKKFNSLVGEKFMRIERVSNNLRVSAEQYPSLYRPYIRMAQALDVPKLPELYIDTTPIINAQAMGTHDFYIVVNSGLIDLMTEDELLAIIGHELGHVKCQHMLYKTITYLFQLAGVQLIDALLPGVGYFAAQGALLALLEWNRKSEFSCDRAGALCTQNLDTMQSALAKLSGFHSRIQEPINLAAIKQQATEYADIGANNIIEKMMKVYALLQTTHPHPVVRVKEIEDWYTSDQFRDILSGNYRTVDQDTSRAPAAGPAPKTSPFSPPTRTCPKCGGPHAADARFCPSCGTLINQAQAQVQSQSPEPVATL